MPIFRNEVADGVSFNGAAGRGLFDITQTGQQAIQPDLNSVKFHTEGAAVTWDLYIVDPQDPTNKTLILSSASAPAGTSQNMAIEGRGSLILPVDTDGNAWPLVFESAVMSGGKGFLSIDYDFKLTEG